MKLYMHPASITSRIVRLSVSYTHLTLPTN